IEVDDFIELFRRPSEEEQLKMLSWNDRELDGAGFVPWTGFDHPQLGRVEIGGWKTKFTFQNPPPKFLEAECRKLTDFALSHASCAPRLEAELSEEKLPAGLRKLELTVENTGFLPTNVSRIAVDKKTAKPVEVEVTLPEGATLVSGEKEVDLGHLAGRSSLEGNSWKNPAFWAGLPSDYARRVAWVVSGGGTVEVEVRSGKAGTQRLKSG
ncbi:MAG: carboxypeptidase, partial [Rubrobacteraceae bacterium]